MSPVLTNYKEGFQLALRKDMGHEIVKKPLHTGSGRLCVLQNLH